MARVTVEDCLAQDDNRFSLVIAASDRARKLLKGAEPLVKCKNKVAVTSLREVAAGKVRLARTSDEVVQEWLDERSANRVDQ